MSHQTSLSGLKSEQMLMQWCLFHERLKIVTDSWSQKNFSLVAGGLVIHVNDSIQLRRLWQGLNGVRHAKCLDQCLEPYHHAINVRYLKNYCYYCPKVPQLALTPTWAKVLLTLAQVAGCPTVWAWCLSWNYECTEVKRTHSAPVYNYMLI